jgi:FAD/FMN-containing dehydrogenase
MGYTVPYKGGIALDLRRMDKILEIDTDSGYALVEAGCLYDSLTAALGENGVQDALHVLGRNSLNVYLNRSDSCRK